MRSPTHVHRTHPLTATPPRIQDLVGQGTHMETRNATPPPTITHPQISEPDRPRTHPRSHPCFHSCSLLLPSVRWPALVVYMHRTQPYLRNTSPLRPIRAKMPVWTRRSRAGMAMARTHECPTRPRRLCGCAPSRNHCPTSRDFPRIQALCKRWQL